MWSVRDSCMVRGKKWTPGPIVCLRNTGRPCEKWSAHTKARMVAKPRAGGDKKLNINFMWPNWTPSPVFVRSTFSQPISKSMQHVQNIRLQRGKVARATLRTKPSNLSGHGSVRIFTQSQLTVNIHKQVCYLTINILIYFAMHY